MGKDTRSRAELKKTLHKMVVARSDLDASISMAKTALKHSIDKDYDIRYGMQTAMIILYSRPFTQSDVVGKLGAEWSRFSRNELNETHKYVIDSRNTWVAHSEPKDRKVRVIMPGVSLPPPMGIQTEMTVESKNYLLTDDFIRLLALCSEDIICRLTPRIDGYLRNLYDERRHFGKFIELDFTDKYP